MTEFLINNMAPIIFAFMVIFMLVGFPVAFALAANGVVFGLIGIELGLIGPQIFQALPDRVFGVMSNDTLLAIPFFTFMGLILERSGMAEPIMLRYGYDKRLASGVIAASGTLAQIIPPSLVLIIMADQLGRSVGDMYKGAFIPGFVLTGLYVGYVVLITLFKPSHAPALPPEARSLRGAKLALRVLTTLVPPLFLIFLVLGTIFLGIATPTEGGAMGATGALIMAIMRKRLSWSLLKQAMETTAKLTTFVVFILVGARVFSLTFYGVDGHRWVEHLLTDLPGGEIGFLIVTNILIFFLAFFLDFFELSFIVVPLLGPVADKLGIDLIWFGVLLAVNMQTSFMHPPFGFALFYLRSVAPASIKTTDIYWGAIPFVCIQIIMVGLVIMFPQMVTFGLDEDVKVDLDKVIIEMQDSGYGVPETPPGISGTPEENAPAEEDPNKAIMDSMKQDAAK